MKVLTVSIAAYNVEQYLGNTIESLIKCSNKELLDILIIDDGSSDATKDIAQKYQVEDPDNIRFVSKPNGGYGSTINTAIRYAKGRYFKTLDGDDWFDSDELDKLLLALSNCDADLALSNYTQQFEDGSNKLFSEKGPYFEVLPITRLTHINANPALAVRTELLRKIPQISEHCYYTDVEYCFFSVVQAESFVVFPYDVYQYRLGRVGQSVSAQGRVAHLGDHEHVVRRIVEESMNCTLPPLCQDEPNSLAKAHVFGYYCYVNRSNRWKIKGEYGKYLRWYKALLPEEYKKLPVNVKSIILWVLGIDNYSQILRR